ncbi:MAG: FAD-dependent oxidoreductase, partial [Erysipelothrix sp.]|nr:FAD-dependent oxidoreductase [Erysipelothrix sp.]
MKEIDALIIGKGPAGIQASLYMVRANITPVVIGKDIGANMLAKIVDNFYGFPEISGSDLVEIGIKQAEGLDIPVITDEVVSLAFDGDRYIVTTVNETYACLALLLATGTQRTIPRVRKIRNYTGKGVSYCAVCDGFFFKNKVVAVMGNAEYAASEARELVELASKVYVLTDGLEPTAEFDERVIIVKDKLVS